MNTDTRLELRQREIIEEFEMFSDWMEKYEHIIEIGKEYLHHDNWQEKIPKALAKHARRLLNLKLQRQL